MHSPKPDSTLTAGPKRPGFNQNDGGLSARCPASFAAWRRFQAPIKWVAALLLFLGGTVGGSLEAEYSPAGLLLTWQGDPTTTMTIDWHLQGGETGPSSLEYRGPGQDDWSAVPGTPHPFPFSERTILRVELRNLKPGTTYQFRFGPDSRTFRFRTMPADLSQPLVFAVGGDLRHSQEMMEWTNSQVLRYDPAFVVWGGDFAYADGREDRVRNWYELFDAILSTFITAEGRAIPVVAAIGNHEVRGGYYRSHEEFSPTDEWRARIAPFFYGGLLAFPGQPGYATLDFGQYLSLVILDSGHTNPIPGRQTEWLRESLAQRTHFQHVFPVYHTPAYPSVRPEDSWYTQEIRQHWVPLFEEFGLRTAFEHHDHAYKRTHPLKAGRIDPNGIVYLGDGAWGVATRTPRRPDESWYLARSEAKRHGIIVTLHENRDHYLVVDSTGTVIDQFPEVAPTPPESTWAAQQVLQLRARAEKPHLLARETPESNWFPLDLTEQANQPRATENGWIGTPLLHLPSGLQRVHGVPFSILEEEGTGQSVIAMRSAQRQLSAWEDPLPTRVRIPLRRSARALYFLHGCGWATAGEQAGHYRIVYADGSAVEIPIVPLGNPTSAQALELGRQAANVQDWWPGAPVLERVGEGGVLAFPVTDWSAPADYIRHLYSLEWPNPKPGSPIEAIEIVSNPEAQTSLVIVSITALD